MLRAFASTACLLAALTACQQPIAGPARTPIETTHTPGSAGALQSDPQYLLTTRGDYVLSHSPPGVEISLGSKQVRRVGWHDPVEVPARISVDG
jgi:hypothetical protein